MTIKKGYIKHIFKQGPDYCGVPPVILKDCIFNPVCKWHDEQYEHVDWTVGTKELDKDFYKRCLLIAADSRKLQWQAYLMYKCCRAWGMMRMTLYKTGVSW